MTQVDGATTSAEDRILIMAATNIPWELDEAVLRSTCLTVPCVSWPFISLFFSISFFPFLLFYLMLKWTFKSSYATLSTIWICIRIHANIHIYITSHHMPSSVTRSAVLVSSSSAGFEKMDPLQRSRTKKKILDPQILKTRGREILAVNLGRFQDSEKTPLKSSRTVLDFEDSSWRF